MRALFVAIGAASGVLYGWMLAREDGMLLGAIFGVGFTFYTVSEDDS